MYLACSLLALVGGYLLLVYASKQETSLKKIGKTIAWLVMLFGIIGIACFSYKKITGKHGGGYHACAFTSGKHHKCSYHKKSHKHHSDEVKTDSQ